MLEVLLFSFSVSLDAFGYSLGYGSKNIKLTRKDFLFLNVANCSILVLFLIYYPILLPLSTSNIARNMSGFLLLVLGSYNIIVAFWVIFVRFKAYNKNISPKMNFQIAKLTLLDLSILLLVFCFENLFSTFIFYSTLSHIELFICSHFLFHYLLFLLGFEVGQKLRKFFLIDSSFFAGIIFTLIGLFNLLE